MALSYPIPTVVTAEFIDAAEWNALADSINFLANPPSCALSHSVAQSIANASWQAVVFNTETYDTAGLHSTASNTSRITIPTGCGGIYTLSAGWEWAGNATGRRGIGFRVNGTGGTGNSHGFFIDDSDSTDGVGSNFSRPVKLAAGAWIEVTAFQNSGVALNINVGEGGPFFVATWVGVGT